MTQNGPPSLRRLFSDSLLEEYGHNFELYLINQGGRGRERITFNTGFDSFPMFSPDGKKLVFSANRNPDKPRITDVFITDWTE
ncbi:MAG: hypothetical protein DSZ28_03020 [Thiothrix sp.]|nr:MAG: hypothetical protein DSZ28_03020 [Thiothrix sp.]